MLERESSIFFPRFFLFSIPSISFFFFSFLRLRPATLTLIRRRATIFIDNCLPLQDLSPRILAREQPDMKIIKSHLDRKTE